MSAPRGWLRRNLWGLVALLPMLAAAGWVHLADVKRQYWNTKSRDPVPVTGDGWASYSGARIRLATLGPATGLKDFSGDPVAVPPSIKAWQATLAFSDADQDSIGTCKVLLEDTAGNTYAPNPVELGSPGTSFGICAAEDDPAPASYEVVVYFATPAATRPAAITITTDTALPRYARLTPPA